MSMMNLHGGRFAITVNCEDLISLMTQVREIAREEAVAALQKNFHVNFYHTGSDGYLQVK